MDTDVLSLKGESEKQVELPDVFGSEVRPDIIKRAVISSQSSRIQPKGSDQRAGYGEYRGDPPQRERKHEGP